MADSGVSNGAGTLYVVATPIGNRGDMTPRAIATLEQVKLIAAEDTRHSKPLLAHHGINTPLLALHDHNEAQAAERVIGKLRDGDDCALISDAGTPLISDPGFRLVRAAHEAGVKVSPIPGASALIAGLSAAGLATDRFCFEGFPPRQPSARRAAFSALADETRTLVFYESRHRLLSCVADMRATFGDARTVVLARELSKLYEQIHSTTLAELGDWLNEDEDRQRGEFVLMLEGAPPRESSEVALDSERLLSALLPHLPVKKAAAVVAELTGEKKNALYQQALVLKGEG